MRIRNMYIDWRALGILIIILSFMVVLYIYFGEVEKRSEEFCLEEDGIYRSVNNKCTINRVPYYVLYDGEVGYYLQEIRK